jgi:copper chaperone
MKTSLLITGMTCQNCVKHARLALEGVPGVKSAEVDLETGLAQIEGDADVTSLIAAVDEEGYKAQKVE